MITSVESEQPFTDVEINSTLYKPGFVYVWDPFTKTELLPSPKSQEK